MSILLDTNILLRLADPLNSFHTAAKAAVLTLWQRGEMLQTVPQNLFEFWAVATRPIVNNGLGLSTSECVAELSRIKLSFPLLLDMPALLTEWEALVAAHDCKGKQAHDARLVAAMRTHGINQLLTFNTGDFTRYPGLTLLDPAQLAASGSSTSGGVP